MSLTKQIGGDHYQSLSIQPWDAMQSWYGEEAFVQYLKMNALKYIARDKDNEIEDIEKAIHCLEKCKDILEDNDLSQRNTLDADDIASKLEAV